MCRASCEARQLECAHAHPYFAAAIRPQAPPAAPPLPPPAPAAAAFGRMAAGSTPAPRPCRTRSAAPVRLPPARIPSRVLRSRVVERSRSRRMDSERTVTPPVRKPPGSPPSQVDRPGSRRAAGAPVASLQGFGEATGVERIDAP